MKHFPAFLLACFSLIFTGCFDILEDISLNGNGSGKYSLTFDMDAVINDPFMKEMMLESFKNDGTISDEETGKIVMDSMVYLKDDPKFASLRDNKTLYESAKIHTVINEETGKMFVNFSFDFKNVSDIETFFKALNSDVESQNMFAGLEQVVGGSDFAFSKKSLTRKSIAKNNTQSESPGSEDMEMLKMFMSESKLKTLYTFPGNVKKSTIPNSVVNKNEVAVEVPLLDVMDGKASMDGEIRFKN